jgi:hypothetical protein
MPAYADITGHNDPGCDDGPFTYLHPVGDDGIRMDNGGISSLRGQFAHHLLPGGRIADSDYDIIQGGVKFRQRDHIGAHYRSVGQVLILNHKAGFVLYFYAGASDTVYHAKQGFPTETTRADYTYFLILTCHVPYAIDQKGVKISNSACTDNSGGGLISNYLSFGEIVKHSRQAKSKNNSQIAQKQPPWVAIGWTRTRAKSL